MCWRNVRQFEYPEDDVLLLGDLNQAPGKLQRLESIPAFTPIFVGQPTNARKNKTLDNILIDSQNTSEFTGRAGHHSQYNSQCLLNTQCQA
jgi:hypothetical protein